MGLSLPLDRPGGNLSAPHVEELVLSESQKRHASGRGNLIDHGDSIRVTMAMLSDAEFTSGTFSVEGNTVYVEPKSFKKAVSAPDSDKWWAAVEDEMASLGEFGTYTC